jgi:hypothetical protein
MKKKDVTMKDLTEYGSDSFYKELTVAQLFKTPILEHPQPLFFPQCDRPSFTPTHKIGNVTGTCIVIFIFFCKGN